MRSSFAVLIAAVAASFFAATYYATSDDAVINTPTILAALKGEWELQPATASTFKQRLTFDGSRCGEWRKSKETLPVSLTFYVEGNELLLQHYYEPNGAFNYRLKQLRFGYKLEDQILTLTCDGVTETWKRVRTPGGAKD